MSKSEPRIGPALIKLSEAFDRYTAEARKVLEESGLSEEEQELVLRGDLKSIRERLAAEYPDQPIVAFGVVRGVVR